MEQQLKQRIVGATVLVALGVIFIPIFLDQGAPEDTQVEAHEALQPPEDRFDSRVVPLDQDDVTMVTQAATATAEELVGPIGPAAGGAPEGAPEAVEDGAPGEAPPAKPRTGVAAWVVQVGSFTSAANAEALEARLRRDGYKAFIEPLSDESGTAYRVRIGPELSRSKADEIVAKLEKDSKTAGIVMRYP